MVQSFQKLRSWNCTIHIVSDNTRVTLQVSLLDKEKSNEIFELFLMFLEIFFITVQTLHGLWKWNSLERDQGRRSRNWKFLWTFIFENIFFWFFEKCVYFVGSWKTKGYENLDSRHMTFCFGNTVALRVLVLVLALICSCKATRAYCPVLVIVDSFVATQVEDAF